MFADGRVLFVEVFGDDVTFSVSFVIAEFDGLVRWAEFSFPRQSANEIGKF